MGNKKKRNFSIAGIFQYLQEMITKSDAEKESFLEEYNRKIEELEKHNSILDADIAGLKEQVNDLQQHGGGGTGGGTENTKVIEGEEVKVTTGENGKPVIELKGSPLIPGSIKVVEKSSEEEVTTGFTINYRKGEITFKGDVDKTEYLVDYKYLQNANLPDIEVDSGKVNDLVFAKDLVSPAVFPVTTIDLKGKKGEICYNSDDNKFITTSDLNYEIEAVAIDKNRDTSVVNKTLNGKGASNLISHYTSLRSDPLVFVNNVDNREHFGNTGEIWVEDITPYRVTVKNTGGNAEVRILITSDYTSGALSGRTNFSGTSGRRVTHNLKLDPEKYTVLVQPLSKTDGKVGEYWVEKDENSFTIKNTGESKALFNYLIVEK